MNSSAVREHFWELPLSDLNHREWELLCDGCARCCLKKLQDDAPAQGTGDLVYTRVVCRYLDQRKCACTAYGQRNVLVPDCLVLDMSVLRQSVDWIPDTCAYKLRYQHKPLPAWHPLLTGSREAMLEQGIAVTGRVISEEYVHDDGLEEHVIRWVRA
ncbi:MAG: YcgN family cysteine cluster protein [Pseudohongiella sp.]|uniref:YcgN family cysteine cluster protein n=1 Tax=Pseudohongiella sp. TaxID=1979412 RepID=UPI00349FEE83